MKDDLSNNNSFIFIDVEGVEIFLLDQKLIHELKKTPILVECHDFVYENITKVKKRDSLPHMILQK